MTPERKKALEEVRRFLGRHTPYDLLPPSSRVPVLDTRLVVRKALAALLQHGLASAPLYDAEKKQYAGTLTMTILVHLIHHYHAHPTTTKDYGEVIQEVDRLQIQELQEKVQGTWNGASNHLVSIRPCDSLVDAAKTMLERKARRLPLVDVDGSGDDVIVGVLTQHRLLRFLAVNFPDIDAFQENAQVKELGIGQYEDVATATLETPVAQVIRKFVERRVTAVPIIDDQGVVLNVYEKADVLTLMYEGKPGDLELPVCDALLRRSLDFEGVHTCRCDTTLGDLLLALQQYRIHRFIVVDEDNRLCGVITLSDMIRYLLS
ncbi:MAG: hypothetical protein DHS80DRAFT_12142 [Piptocephalis tieghemiana]|nr:MAG: hypothetical protein DHS80DRAFT_12142 [Piptocephalis tieghemiana]